ncbi:MAG TPA: acyltransferase [Polyangiaceae bacterium]|nr:acyltransferase [Polyangiaceae bacterium]HMR76118.1 acyltransferase [Polyangiaceae bacterium]
MPTSLRAPVTTAAAVRSGTKRRRRFLQLELLDNRFPALHGMRVLAIVSVVQFHVTWVFAGEQAIPLDRDFVRSSLALFFGMDLFFFLSGFLIGSILLHTLSTSGIRGLWRFYLRRIFRTFPAYWVVLTLLVLLFPLSPDQRQHLLFEYIYATNLMPLHRDQVVMFWGWSLALEEQFYLLVPFLFYGLRALRKDRYRIALLAALCGLALAHRLYLFFNQGPWTDYTLYDRLYFRPDTRFDALLYGIILAIIEFRHAEAVARWLKDPFHRALLLVPSLGILWVLLEPTLFGIEYLQLVRVFAWGTLPSLMYLAWVPLLLHSDGALQRWLGRGYFRYIGTLGYGVYLLHIPILDHLVVPAARALQQGGVSMLAVWPLSLTVLMIGSLAAAYVLHLLVEKPALWLRARVAG